MCCRAHFCTPVTCVIEEMSYKEGYWIRVYLGTSLSSRHRPAYNRLTGLSPRTITPSPPKVPPGKVRLQSELSISPLLNHWVSVTGAV
uniref:Uncharacterized protein n=1 Tax=Anguilla anguilla TaxID=7936 RepID=A0A0E9X162_ANGAN